MAFADPVADVTYATVAQTLPRISTSGSLSKYRKSDGSLVMTISHQTNRNRIRSMVRLDRNADTNADGILESYGAYLVLDRPTSGFAEADVVNLVTALTGFLTASTNAAIKKINSLET
jgi:hypothetical protein